MKNFWKGLLIFSAAMTLVAADYGLPPHVILFPQNSGGSTNEMRFRELWANGVNYIALKAPASITSNVAFILPGVDGAAGQLLSTNGSGVLSWASSTLPSVGASGTYVKSTGAAWAASTGSASGVGTCTNQFARVLNSDAAPTCASVAVADVTAVLKTEQIAYTFFDAAADLADLDIPSIIPNRARAVTLTEVYCEIDAGSASINLQRDDGSPANILSTSLACSTAGATSTSFSGSEASISSGYEIDHVTVSISGVRRLNVALKYTVD